MYKLTKAGGIIRQLDEAHIPSDEANNDYQDYLVWIDEGNTPDPYVEPPVTIQQQINVLEASMTPRRLREAMLNKGQGMQFIQDVEDQITILRDQL